MSLKQSSIEKYLSSSQSTDSQSTSSTVVAVDEEGSQPSNNDERDLEENLSGSEYEEVSLAMPACFSEECLDLLLQPN